MKRIYISGGMRGYKNFNFLNFFRAERKLKKLGWEVINPARESWRILKEGGYKTFDDIPMRVFVREDNLALLECDAIYLLNGWEHSVGANGEFNTAKWANLEFYYENSI